MLRIAKQSCSTYLFFWHSMWAKQANTSTGFCMWRAAKTIALRGTPFDHVIPGVDNFDSHNHTSRDGRNITNNRDIYNQQWSFQYKMGVVNVCDISLEKLQIFAVVLGRLHSAWWIVWLGLVQTNVLLKEPKLSFFGRRPLIVCSLSGRITGKKCRKPTVHAYFC